VGNCAVVPGGLTVLPGASLHDGKLNMLHVAPRSFIGWFPVAWRGVRGSNRPVNGLGDHLVEEVTIIPEAPAAVQVDGDVWHEVHRIEISVDAAALVIRGRAFVSDELTGNREGNPDVEAGMDGS
jgi:diacylglycerol kinase family enzyme